ncbi:MAG TPA: redoxin domain-containing protein [Pyrinomonadaceae bacterium]|nr:redoxin domain-containing protein [Pyrinomonadaceae bacterium]
MPAKAVSQTGKTMATKQAENSPSAATLAVAKLRELYSKRDYESGYSLGERFAEEFPDNAELRAWFIVNMARNDMSKEAVDVAKKLVESHGESPWAWFALASAHVRNQQKNEAAAAAEKALKLNPDDEEFIFLNASALLSQKKYDEIYRWLDKNRANIKDNARLLYFRAETLYRQSTEGKVDEAKRNSSFETFAKARRVSPNSVAANYIYGLYLNSARRFVEALPILKKAVALAPGVAHVRQQYWRALLNGQPAKTAGRRLAETVADMNALLRLRPDSINALDTISAFYEQELQNPDKKNEFDAILLEKFPQSRQAERILINRIRRFSTLGVDKKVDEEKRQQLVQMTKDFVSRPKKYVKIYFGEAYSSLFYDLKGDKKVSNAELLRLAEETSKYPQLGVESIYSMIVFAFAERGMFAEGKRFVETGFEKVKQESQQQKTFIKDEREIEKNLNSMNAVIYSANGWLLYKEGNLSEAEKSLERAVELNNEDSVTYNRLGQIHEAKNELDKAEDAYIKGFASPRSGSELNKKSLEALYKKRRGNLAGIEAYFENVGKIERQVRRARVVGARIKDSKSVSPFALKNLEDKTISSADLRGKIVVANIWGTWCGPCVQEMPEFQELHKKYAGDKDVAILTINNDGDAALVKKFMTDKKFDFVVLRDADYLDAAGVNAFPTTWFIDRDGKISFVQIGNNGKLLEESVWRIEELKK